MWLTVLATSVVSRRRTGNKTEDIQWIKGGGHMTLQFGGGGGSRMREKEESLKGKGLKATSTQRYTKNKIEKCQFLAVWEQHRPGTQEKRKDRKEDNFIQYQSPPYMGKQHHDVPFPVSAAKWFPYMLFPITLQNESWHQLYGTHFMKVKKFVTHHLGNGSHHLTRGFCLHHSFLKPMVQNSLGTEQISKNIEEVKYLCMDLDELYLNWILQKF